MDRKNRLRDRRADQVAVAGRGSIVEITMESLLGRKNLLLARSLLRVTQCDMPSLKAENRIVD